MGEHSNDLKRFERRVRVVRSWKGMAMGACVGSLAAAVWAGLDWANVAYAEWSSLGMVVAAGAVLGLFAGLLQKVSPKALADSIDRRAALEDRLVTSVERSNSTAGFDAALHADADSHLKQLKPASLYPVRVGRWQGAAVALAALASTIFLLGNTSVLLSDQAKRDKQDVKDAGKVVERVLKPVDEHLRTETTNADDKKLAEELRRLAKELEKARLTKEEALQKANEIQKQAEQLVKDRAHEAENSLAKAESAFDKLEKEQLEKAGLKDMDPSIAKMTPAERDAKTSELQKEQAQNSKQMESLKSQMSQPGLSKEQQMQLSQEMQKLLQSQQNIQKQLEQLKLSKNVQDMLKRMMENPLFKKLLEMQQKLEKAMQEAQQKGQQQQLTHEQIEQMQKELEELAKKLKDDKAMTDYLQSLLDAMKQGCGT